MFYKETEFQDSPIGKIPKDWDVQELGDESIADIIAGQSPPSSTYNKENRGLPFLQGKMEFGEMFPSPTTYCLEPIKIAKKNDVLLSVRAPVGDVNIAPSECCIGRGLAAIRAKVDKLNHLFLFYYLKLEGKRFEALSTGSTFKAIRIREIEKFSIPVPSVEEQGVVVGVLGVVDSAIELVDRVIWKTGRLKKGLMQTLLTRGIGHTEYKETPIGRIPKEWEVDKLESVVEIHDSKRIPLSEMERKGRKGPYPYCGANGIIDHINDFIFDGEYVLLAEDGGSYGKFESSAYVMSGKFWVNNHAHILRANAEKTSNQFLKLTLDFLDLNPYIVGSTRKKLNQEQMRGINIPLPPVPEQQRIAEIFSEVDKKLEVERSEKARLERVKRGLMDLLLTGKVRVKVN